MKKLQPVILATAIAVLTACGGGGTSTTLGPTVTAVTYAANVQRISYSDGTTTNNTATSSAITWAADHVTKTTTYSFANGGTNAVAATVLGVAGTPTYNGNTQTIVTTYGDGTTATASNTATSSAITWAADHVTKTTTYSFANGGTNAVAATVLGVAGTPTYNGNTQTIVTTYGDGTTATASNTATSSAITWAADHVTKTTTYSFANGGTNAVVATVAPTSSNPTLTAASYPANWTTTGTITPPSTSTSTVNYGDGYTFTQDGTANKPFWQSTLTRNSIADPSAFVYSTTTLYDLRWGTPDRQGPALSATFADGAVNSLTLTGPLTLWGQTLSGQCSLGFLYGFCLNGATVSTPHTDVLEAWRQGWTGKGVNIVMEDSLQRAHGATTTILANRYAIGATIYGVNLPTGLGIYNFDGSAANPVNMVNIGVVNASYGMNLWALTGHSGPWTTAELNAANAAVNPLAQSMINRYTGAVGSTFTNFNYTDAVIVKSAGNDATTADKEAVVKALATNTNISPRLLVVGALTMAGSTSNPVTLATYSNIAGNNTSVSSRFLVASGTTPFGPTDMSLNGIAIDATTSVDPNGVVLGSAGTSYAAPRVTGYAAILRQKFPNLNAEKSANILLDTARYDTLSCYYQAGGCDPTIYGKGEASLSRALAPVGRLR